MTADGLDPSAFEGCVLLRIVAGGREGVVRSDLRRDLAGFVSHRLDPATFRHRLSIALTNLQDLGALKQAGGGRLFATRSGREAASDFLGMVVARDTGWEEIRDVFLAGKAMGLPAEEWPRRARQFSSADGLRIAILTQAFGLSLKPGSGLGPARSALAAKALEGAFGKGIRSRLGARPGLEGRAGRAIAGELARRPRKFNDDKSLISQLAAEQVGAMKKDVSSLRLALMRRLCFGSEPEAEAAAQSRTPTADAERAARDPDAGSGRRARDPIREAMPGRVSSSANGHARGHGVVSTSRGGNVNASGNARGRGSGEATTQPGPAVVQNGHGAVPELAAFAETVKALAGQAAEGWPGNRKAYVSRVWRRVREVHPEWGMDTDAFKHLLAEAHRKGHIVLVNADLRDKENIDDVRDSAIHYKNMEWHLIRVGE